MKRQAPFSFGGVEIAAGERATVDLPMARLYTHSEMTLPVQVVHGKQAGPTLFVSAAIHGDEINGVEIIRRLLNSKSKTVEVGLQEECVVAQLRNLEVVLFEE